jgi:hypothetical protein
MQGLILHRGAAKLGRHDLPGLPAPDSTDTHTVVPHSDVVESALEALAYRRVEVVKDEYGVSKEGAKMFGVLTLNIERNGVNLVLALRNSHDKSFALGMVAGFRVFVCDNLAFRGEFFAIAKRHSKRLMDGFQDTIAIGVDRVQRQFEPITKQINVWQNHSLADVDAKHLIYRSFIQGELDAPKHLASVVHQSYCEPPHEEFKPRTLWSLQNAFTEAFKALDPLPQYRATASLGRFFENIH